ncbi:MAG: ferritin-like protein [Chloroflexota bacterium]|nr:ferritin-like protein [Chloroflexota bacterium]
MNVAASTESPITIEDREELIFMLCEAAELEHMIMLQYLFAAFSLKRDEDEGLTPEQLQACKRWDRAVSAVASQEMLHLALCNNLLTAVGGAPHFRRPNFPQRANYFPSGVQFELLPFGERALRHFIYLERPEGMEEHDAPGFDVTAAPAPMPTGQEVVPYLQEFATVGHLYRGLEQGFRHLAEKHGEENLFIGPPRAQAVEAYFRWPDLVAVTDLASAVKAIETIVEQGEGARGHWEEAHYGKFLRIFSEYQEVTQRDPAFEPARPVQMAWCRIPGTPGVVEPCMIAEQVTAEVADLFNASYEILVQMLARFFAHTEESDEELNTLSDTAVTAMFALIRPLGRIVTRLPVGPHQPGRTAGPSFEYYRSGYLLPHKEAVWQVMRERLLELEAACSEIASRPGAPAGLEKVRQGFHELAEMLARHSA